MRNVSARLRSLQLRDHVEYFGLAPIFLPPKLFRGSTPSPGKHGLGECMCLRVWWGTHPPPRICGSRRINTPILSKKCISTFTECHILPAAPAAMQCSHKMPTISAPHRSFIGQVLRATECVDAPRHLLPLLPAAQVAGGLGSGGVAVVLL